MGLVKEPDLRHLLPRNKIRVAVGGCVADVGGSIGKSVLICHFTVAVGSSDRGLGMVGRHVGLGYGRSRYGTEGYSYSEHMNSKKKPLICAPFFF